MLRTLCALTLLLGPASLGYAATIDDFTFTTASHTYTFSLPAQIPDYFPPGYPPPGPHVGIDNYFTNATGSVDGVCCQKFNLDFATTAAPGYFPYGLQFSTAGMTAPYSAQGPRLVGDPFSYFPTGTFSYNDYYIPQPNTTRDGPYTLTITPEAASAAAPEPASFALLLTGAAGSLATLRRRLRK